MILKKICKRCLQERELVDFDVYTKNINKIKSVCIFCEEDRKNKKSKVDFYKKQESDAKRYMRNKIKKIGDKVVGEVSNLKFYPKFVGFSWYVLNESDRSFFLLCSSMEDAQDESDRLNGLWK